MSFLDRNHIGDIVTTISNADSCAAHCANMRQSDPCSCNAIVFVKETEDCIIGTARLPLETEDTERIFLVEGTGGLLRKI